MKTNLWLFVVALVLAVASYFRMDSIRQSFVDVREIPKMFPGFTPDRVNTVVIRKMDLKAMEKEKNAPGVKKGNEEPKWEHVTQLVRKSDKWFVHYPSGLEFPADKNLVKELLDNVRDVPASKTDVVSDDPESHEEYEVDEKHAVQVIAFDKDGKQMAFLLVGRKPKAEPGSSDYTAWQGVFVRQKDDPRVIRYDKSYWTVDADPAHWLDKNILSFERDKVKRLTVVNPKGRWVVEKTKDGKWRLKEPLDYPAKASEVDAILNYVSSLYMEELIGPRDPQSEAKCGVGSGARYVITVEMKDGKSKHTLRVGRKNPDKEGEVYAVVDDKPYIVTIGKYIVESFRKTVDDLKDTEAASKPASKPSGGAKAASRPSTGKGKGGKSAGKEGRKPASKPASRPSKTGQKKGK